MNSNNTEDVGRSYSSKKDGERQNNEKKRSVRAARGLSRQATGGAT